MTHVSVVVPVAEAVVGAGPGAVAVVGAGAGVAEVLEFGAVDGVCPCGRWGMSAAAGTMSAGRRHGRCGHKEASWHLTVRVTHPFVIHCHIGRK